ncbi:hypothetical protein BOX15_Mlig009251g1 [Macrostomum lignano]|uniref:Class I SAM-dependent methyltransferase n=2 Tax=Macrostomum lignano TaxID=282301 RepID=A0A1I8J6R0_9PLAT|nr:hypothetical protein BOX15_Mlig009251g1 [Macrostomum lignano]
MSAFYGPESPRPFSVISERYQRDVPIQRQLPAIDDGSQFSFGDEYNKAICDSVSRLAEINVDDLVCYVGPKKGSLAKVLEQRLKLVKGIQEVTPGEIVYEAAKTGRLIPVSVVNSEAEEHFSQLASQRDDDEDSPPIRYDKVIVRDSLEYLQDRKTFYMNAMRCLRPQGSLLIIQRPADMITLPYYSEARDRVQDSDVPVVDTINEIQSLGFDVEWDIIALPVLLSRTQWLTLLYHRYPNHLEVTSDADVTSGVRELSEGSLKYMWDRLEFTDRLLFVSVSQPLQSDALPECRRHGGSVLTTEPAPLIFTMPISPEMRPMVRDDNSEELERNRRLAAESRKEWFGTFCMENWRHVDSSVIPSQLTSRRV